MKIEKKSIGKLNKCYSIAGLKTGGRDCFLIAAEKQDECFLFDAEGNFMETVWEKPGGVMTMVQVPGSDGQFLATHKFFSPNDSKEAKLVIAEKRDGEWRVRTLAELPFVHRFDILTRNGVNYLIACTLKSDHEYKDDWRSPGKVYAAVLPDDLSPYCDENQLELTVIKDNLLKNHGYCRSEENGVSFGLVGTENGVFRFTPPASSGEAWTVEKVTDIPASDAVMVDFDGDGEKELALIHHFHGNKVMICKKTAGVYETVYETDAPFAHAIYGGPICGRERLVIGFRDGAMENLVIDWDADNARYAKTVFDTGCGAANFARFVNGGGDVIVATNRGIDEIAMYSFTEE